MLMKISEGIATKIPGSKVETRWVLVTPDMAELYLVANTENRMLRPKHIDRIASDMKKDRFLTTHQGIAFDEDGVMIDGQHRCQAIVDSGKGQWMLITSGLPSHAKRVVDGGAKRAAHDFMPGKFKSLRSASIRIMLGIERCEFIFTAQKLASEMQQVTASEIQEDWDNYSNIEQLASLASESARSVATCGPAAMLASGLCFPGTAEEFLNGVWHMTGLEPGDPRLALLKFRGGPKRLQSSTAAFVAIKAAKAFSEGKQMNLLRFSPNEMLKL
jgi:hypothetical protein